MTDEQKRSHAMSQLRATRELYSDCGDSVYLAVIDAHLRTITDVDERRRVSSERRTALLEDLKTREERRNIEEKEERRHFLGLLKLPELDSIK
jgi:hypothetical protein